jgi:DNA topoisomerase-1
VIGKELDLPPESEEVAGFYAACIGTIHADDDKFNENFFDDWKTVLKKYPPVRFSVLLISILYFVIELNCL